MQKHLAAEFTNNERLSNTYTDLTIPPTRKEKSRKTSEEMVRTRCRVRLDQ